MSQLLKGSWENWAIKRSKVVYSGSNTDYKSSEPLKTLVMLCYSKECILRKSIASELTDHEMPSGPQRNSAVTVKITLCRCCSRLVGGALMFNDTMP